MKKELINKYIKTEKFHGEDYWLDKIGSVAGLFLFFALCTLATLPLKSAEAQINEFFYWLLFVGLSIIFVYQLRAFIHEDDLQKIYTGLDAASNHKTISTCLEALDWTIVEKEPV